MYLRDALNNLPRFKARYVIADEELEWITSRHGIERLREHIIMAMSRAAGDAIIKKVIDTLEVYKDSYKAVNIYEIDFVLMSKDDFKHFMDAATVAEATYNFDKWYDQKDTIVEADFVEINVPMIEVK